MERANYLISERYAALAPFAAGEQKSELKRRLQRELLRRTRLARLLWPGAAAEQLAARAARPADNLSPRRASVRFARLAPPSAAASKAPLAQAGPFSCFLSCFRAQHERANPDCCCCCCLLAQSRV